MWQSCFWQIALSIYLIFPTAASTVHWEEIRRPGVGRWQCKAHKPQGCLSWLFFFSPLPLFFFSPSPPLLIADFQQFGLSNSPSALSPSPKNGKPVQLIHREASRRWIFGIEAVLPTRAGREPRPPMVLGAKWKAILRVGCLEQHSFLAPCHQAFSLCQLGIFTWKVMSLDYFQSM